MIKIVYIAGDGRSGSTLLDSILANVNNAISVGECHRFWVRYLEGTSLCGCGEPIVDCPLWSEMHAHLQKAFPEYKIEDFAESVRKIQYFKNFRNIPEYLKTAEGQYFARIVSEFYRFIATTTNSTVIIDSSKSISWGYLLQNLHGFDVRILHLERNLDAVANSWKKKVRLPEYKAAEVYMPIKSDILILKTWFKIKVLAKKLQKGAYLFVSYERLCTSPKKVLEEINRFINADLQLDKLYWVSHHAIGGNPMRMNQKKKIEISAPSKQLSNLKNCQNLFFKAFGKLAKLFWS